MTEGQRVYVVVGNAGRQNGLIGWLMQHPADFAYMLQYHEQLHCTLINADGAIQGTSSFVESSFEKSQRLLPKSSNHDTIAKKLLGSLPQLDIYPIRWASRQCQTMPHISHATLLDRGPRVTNAYHTLKSL
jgi:hypothetical protein